MNIRTVLIFLLLCISLSLSAYEWIPFGPPGVKATNICFGAESYGVVCTEDGLYLYEDDMEWHLYSYGLSVIEIVYFDTEKILLVMGDGTWSDGIYTFDLQTHEFEVVEWFVKPLFLRYFESGSIYFAGGEENGLLQSSDGVNWSNVAFFDTIPCVDIAFYGEHIVVSSSESWENNNLFLSDDAGVTWSIPLNYSHFSEIEFNGAGVLFAILPGITNSSGVYRSSDYGYSWEVVNWEFSITSLVCDPFGFVMVGWENGYGIARLNPAIWEPPFVFLNDGLPDTHVLKLKINPIMSAPNIFACTESGVYYSYDYLTYVAPIFKEGNFNIYPNPVQSGTSIQVESAVNQKNKKLKIFDGRGALIFQANIQNSLKSVDLPQFSSGVYFCILDDGENKWTKKLLIR